MDTVEVTPVKVGDAVLIVNENYEEHFALVVGVHGSNWETYTPSINAVYVSSDETKRDPYGQQLERLSSLAHFNTGPNGMPKPGRYWKNI